jgi:cell division protein FtsB
VKVLLPLSVTILTYLVLSLVWSDYGVIASDRLETHKARLEANIEDLEKRQEELQARMKALRTDPDRIRVEARSLGYFEENEGLVRLESYDPKPAPRSPGRIVQRSTRQTDNGAIIRATAASAGLLALFLMLVFDRREKR